MVSFSKCCTTPSSTTASSRSEIVISEDLQWCEERKLEPIRDIIDSTGPGVEIEMDLSGRQLLVTDGSNRMSVVDRIKSAVEAGDLDESVLINAFPRVRLTNMDLREARSKMMVISWGLRYVHARGVVT